MGASATHRRRASWLALFVLVPLVLVAGRANAQVDPLWDHYKVYFVNPPIPYPVPGPPVTLTDQFGQYTHQVQMMERFMNPVAKTHPPGGPTYPINNPDLHYSWWLISPQPFSAQVAASNQFGDQTLNVFDAWYLLNPALKNQHGAPPIGNHYKCYNCEGQPVNVPVQMVDQFGTWQANVTFPRYLCNPVEKHIGVPGDGGSTYPVLDPNQHYVCYEFQPEDPTPHAVVVTDQFVTDRTADLFPSRLICVPSLKQIVTSTAPSTWGRIKILYR